MNLTPEVTALMTRIREERNAQTRNDSAPPPEPSLNLPLPAAPLLDPPALPPPDGRHAGAAPDAALPEMLARARQKTAVRGSWPRWLQPLTRNQGGFNGILLEAVERLRLSRAQTQEQVQALRDQLAAQGSWLGTMARASIEDREWMLAASSGLVHGAAEWSAQRRRGERDEARLDRLEEAHQQTRDAVGQLGTGGERVEELRLLTQEQAGQVEELRLLTQEQAGRIEALRLLTQEQAGQIRELSEHAREVDRRFEQLGELIGQLHRRTDGHAGHLQATADHLRALQEHADSQNARHDETGGYLGRLQAHADELRARIDERTGDVQRELTTHAGRQNAHNDQVDGHLGRLQRYADSQNARHIEDALGVSLKELAASFDARQARLETALGQLDERQVADATYLKSQASFFARVIERVAVPRDDSGGAPAGRADLAAEHDAHALDAFYLAYENRFRGSRDQIKDKLGVYLPLLEAARIGGHASPVLDLGCGRGEWLELLREHGFTAAGVDLSVTMVEQCRERGLEATEADALDVLHGLPDASRGAITAFHLIEHLPFEVRFRFVQECLRVLQPGGVAIFETPNPENIVVGSCDFWHDYTHQRPLPPGATQFLAEQVGFAEARILPLHPVPEEARPKGDDAGLPDRVYAAFYGPRDYAIVATKACTS